MRSLMLKMKTLFEHKKKDNPVDMYETAAMMVEDTAKTATLSIAMGELLEPRQGVKNVQSREPSLYSESDSCLPKPGDDPQGAVGHGGAQE